MDKHGKIYEDCKLHLTCIMGYFLCGVIIIQTLKPSCKIRTLLLLSKILVTLMLMDVFCARIISQLHNHA